MAMKICGFLLAVIAIAAFQVEQSRSFSRSSLYLDPKHPGVYLTLEKKGRANLTSRPKSKTSVSAALPQQHERPGHSSERRLYN